ncbi:hypothetical protein [Streptomyces sp. SPB074]|uniref:hypothetical protein n=1 Tax=Streptomyces sp. (strain SPB074) TaxID=465543 RepID=UPI00055A6787
MSTMERGTEDGTRAAERAAAGEPAAWETPLPQWSIGEYGEEAAEDADFARRRHEAARRDSLWHEEPAVRRRLPDAVRTSAVRAVVIVALTLCQAVTAFLCTLAGSWLAFPMVLSSVASTVVATWGVLDVWVTRQVWVQRNGVLSQPGSTARQLRGERRQALRAAKLAARAERRSAGRASSPRTPAATGAAAGPGVSAASPGASAAAPGAPAAGPGAPAAGPGLPAQDTGRSPRSASGAAGRGTDAAAA